jgi:hypothetical protein
MLTLPIITILTTIGALSAASDVSSAAAVWDLEQQLTAGAYDEYTDAAGQHNVVVDPQGRIHVVWYVEDYLLPIPFQIFYKRYNPGSGWTQDTCLTQDLMARNIYDRFPSLTVDAQGNLHLVWCAGSTTRALASLYYKRCTPVGPGNGGWQDTARTIGPAASGDSVYTPDVACSQDGHVHVVWSRKSTSFYGIRYRESSDGGNTWLSETSIFDTTTSVGACPQENPTVACAANNSVHIAWSGKDYFLGSFHMYYRKRIGNTWFTREFVVGGNGEHYLPSIAISPITNNPHIVWRRYLSLSVYEIVHSYWENTWQPVQVISGSIDTTQYNPQLAFTPDGSAHAVWHGASPASPSIRQIRYNVRTPAGTWGAATDLTTATVRQRDCPSIAIAGHELHVVWQDDRGTYQNLWYRHGFASFHDVGCRVILSPAGLVDSGTVLTPACSVKNFDTTAESYTVRVKIGAGYNQTVTVAAHQPGTGRYVTFPQWTALPRGVLVVSCSTELGIDAYAGNDKATGSVGVAVHDAGCTRIIVPSGLIDTLTMVTPACSVQNYGTATEDYAVRMRIGSYYNQTASIGSHAPGSRVYVTFPSLANWPRGTWSVTCSTELAADVAPANDRRTGSVTVGIHDVGVSVLMTPNGTLDSSVSVTPACTVYNNGGFTESYNVRMRIGGFYNQTASVSSQSPGTSRAVSFPAYANWPRGTWPVTCSTELATDIAHNNDAQSVSVTVNVNDVGVTRIVAPAGNVDSSTVITPACSLYNPGTAAENYSVRMRIGSFYNQSANVSNHAALTWVYVTFPQYGGWPRGTHAVTCSTELANDANRANDRQTGTVSVRVVDMALTSIIRPVSIEGQGSIPVIVRTRNAGSENTDCRVRVIITDSVGGEVYNQFRDYTAIAPGDSVQAQLTAWIANVTGVYYARARVSATGDQNPGNDSLTRYVTVAAAGIEEPLTSVPLSFAFVGASPNPFANRTTLGYSLPSAMPVRLRMYSATGRLVRVLLSGVHATGHHALDWDGRDGHGRLLGRGIYYCCFDAGNFQSIEKLIKLE